MLLFMRTESSSSPSSPDLPYHRKQLLLAMAGICAAVVVAAFDSTIVSTSMPQVAQALHGMDSYAWVGTGYFLACAITILIFGRIGDLYGRKHLMLISLAIVGLGSILSGVSQSMAQLIGFRIFQGLGGGMMIATTFTAPADIFPDHKERVRWMALVSVAFAVSSGLGPVLGGMLTQALSWRAAFFLTPAAAGVAIYMIWKHFPKVTPPPKADNHRFDWLGAAVLTVAVGAPLAGLELAIAPSKSNHLLLAIGLMLAGGLSAWALIPIERQAVTPIFPLRILRTSKARWLNLAAFLIGAVMYVLIFYIPLLLQDQFGYSPTKAGLLMTPLVAGIPIGSICNGYFFRRISHPQRLMVFGAVMLGLGCLSTVTFTAQSSDTWILLTLALCGFGLGFLLQNFTLFMQMLAERADVGVASGLVQTTRAVGSAAGTATVGILIARISVGTGVKTGLVLCVLVCVFVAWVSLRIRIQHEDNP
jgi:MFS family permease